MSSSTQNNEEFLPSAQESPSTTFPWIVIFDECVSHLILMLNLETMKNSISTSKSFFPKSYQFLMRLTWIATSNATLSSLSSGFSITFNFLVTFLAPKQFSARLKFPKLSLRREKNSDLLFKRPNAEVLAFFCWFSGLVSLERDLSRRITHGATRKS